MVYALHPNEMVTRNITIRNTTVSDKSQPPPFSLSHALFAVQCHTPFSIGNGDYGTHEYMEDITFENCTVRGGLTPNDLRFKPVTAAAPFAPSFEASKKRRLRSAGGSRRCG